MAEESNPGRTTEYAALEAESVAQLVEALNKLDAAEGWDLASAFARDPEHFVALVRRPARGEGGGFRLEPVTGF